MIQAIPQGVPPLTNEPRVISLGGLQAANLAALAKEESLEEAALVQAKPEITGLAGHVLRHWEIAREAKRKVEARLLQNMRARTGEYDPDKIMEIKKHGGAETYAMLTSVKCRAAGSWLRDVLMAGGSEKPWGISPTPIPDLPPDMVQQIVNKVAMHLEQFMQQGIEVSDDELKEAMVQLRTRMLNEIREKARDMAELMERKMEDQLIEGGFLKALSEFIDDIVTFPSAILKGPIVRRKPRLKWTQGEKGWEVVVSEDFVLEWERVSPFNIYPSPEASGIDDGFLIERHRLSRTDLTELIGVEGYDENSIRLVLDEYGQGGLRMWLDIDAAQAEVERKDTLATYTNPDELIDALQYWGSIRGQDLIEHGVNPEAIPDPDRDYHCEIWLIGRYIIKAALNYDKLGRKPYYKASYEEIPGSFWGNAPPDLIRDAQEVVNAATRALVNNMGLASGPQVYINVDRLPPGEDIEAIYPWKIWQVTSDQYANTAAQPPIGFFQPDSRAAELISIIRQFMDFADEWSGIPKYLQGENPGGGAGRTASGLSMMMSNAGKALKQVVANIDNNVLYPLLTRLHQWNMLYGDDDTLKGDVQIHVRGANALVAKEAAQVRRNEFLMATANPIDMQIVGVEGRAEILRETAKGLELNVDRIVPPRDVLQQKLLMQAMGGVPPEPQAASGGRSQGRAGSSAQELMDGSPATDHFQPPRVRGPRLVSDGR